MRSTSAQSLRALGGLSLQPGKNAPQSANGSERPKSRPTRVPAGISSASQARTSGRDQRWPGLTRRGASPPSAQIATAMPRCRSPAAPDQSIAAKWLKRSATLLPQPVPVSDAFLHLALEAALDRLVEGPRLHLVGPVVVAREAFLGIVIVGVAFAVADVLHQLGRRVEDVGRRHQAARLARAAPGGLLRLVDGIRFGRGGEIEAGLRDRQLAFGAAEELVGVLGGEALHHRLRIGEADVLHRRADQP